MFHAERNWHIRHRVHSKASRMIAEFAFRCSQTSQACTASGIAMQGPHVNADAWRRLTRALLVPAALAHWWPLHCVATIWFEACVAQKALILTPALVCMHSQRMKFMCYVQGNCSGNPPAGHPKLPLTSLHPGQCVLATKLPLFAWTGNAPSHVWLHNLYIYAPGKEHALHPLVIWSPPAPTVDVLHATHITTHGGAGFYFKSPAYLAGAPSGGLAHALHNCVCLSMHGHAWPCLRRAVQLVVC
jgi:hypothetical protein